MLTGISIGKGYPPPFDARIWREDMELTISTYIWRLGAILGHTFDDIKDSLQLDLRRGGISVKVLKDFIYSLKGKNVRGIDEDIARFFMMWVIGQIFFPNKNSSVSLGWLSAFEDLSVVGTYDWGGAILARIYSSFDETSMGVQSFNGCWMSSIGSTHIFGYWSLVLIQMLVQGMFGRQFVRGPKTEEPRFR